ncbi:MAG: DUF4430 domain-containing protein [Clostridia bacterium]|nr:DUF4430 domain-containing protein [Clostridia bacterium]
MTQKRTNLKTVIALFMIIAVSLTTLAGCGAETETGNKDITVTIVYKDETSKDFEINTDAEFLADALVEQELIEYDESGYYTTIDGVTADFGADKSWWCLTKDGAMTTDGLNTQPIADGDVFEITYTID